MFRTCWVIFCETSLVTLLDALIQLSENVPLLSSSVERRLLLSAVIQHVTRLFSLKMTQQGRNM
jgi:hypothetical protein